MLEENKYKLMVPGAKRTQEYKEMEKLKQFLDALTVSSIAHGESWHDSDWQAVCLLTQPAELKSEKVKIKGYRKEQIAKKLSTVRSEGKWGWGLSLAARVKVEGCELMFES